MDGKWCWTEGGLLGAFLALITFHRAKHESRNFVFYNYCQLVVIRLLLLLLRFTKVWERETRTTISCRVLRARSVVLFIVEDILTFCGDKNV